MADVEASEAAGGNFVVADGVLLFELEDGCGREGGGGLEWGVPEFGFFGEAAAYLLSHGFGFLVEGEERFGGEE